MLAPHPREGGGTRRCLLLMLLLFSWVRGSLRGSVMLARAQLDAAAAQGSGKLYKEQKSWLCRAGGAGTALDWAGWFGLPGKESGRV